MKRLQKPTVPHTQHWTAGRQSYKQLDNKVEYLDAKESDFPPGVGGDQNRAESLENIGLNIHHVDI